MTWDAAALQARIQPLLQGLRVEAVARTGSTNADLMEAARLGDVQPRVLLAEQQTAGRGRQGRTWQSAPGDSLTFSIGLPLRPLQGWGALSLVVGEAVARALQPWHHGKAPQGQGPLMLKWPNDLWWFPQPPHSSTERAAGRKVGGVLIETLPMRAESSAEGTRWVVIGIGLNVRAVPAATDGHAPMAAACVGDWWPQATAPSCWHLVVPAVLEAVLRFEREGAADVIRQLELRDLLVGQPVTLSAGPVRSGLCTGLDEDGALRVQSGGLVHRVVAGEVSVRPAEPA